MSVFDLVASRVEHCSANRIVLSKDFSDELGRAAIRTMKFQTLTVGRSPDSDVRIRDETVSRRHAELTVTSGGRYYVTDCGSLRGTRVFRSGEWIPLRQGYVDLDERLRFGKFETKLARLLEDNAHVVKACRSKIGVKSRVDG